MFERQLKVEYVTDCVKLRPGIEMRLQEENESLLVTQGTIRDLEEALKEHKRKKTKPNKATEATEATVDLTAATEQSGDDPVEATEATEQSGDDLEQER